MTDSTDRRQTSRQADMQRHARTAAIFHSIWLELRHSIAIQGAITDTPSCSDSGARPQHCTRSDWSS